MCALQIFSSSLLFVFLFSQLCSEQKFLILKTPRIYHFLWIVHFVFYLRHLCLIQSDQVFLVFSLSFKAIGFPFRCVIHSEIIFVCDVMCVSCEYIIRADFFINIFQHRLMQRIFFCTDLHLHLYENQLAICQWIYF